MTEHTTLEPTGTPQVPLSPPPVPPAPPVRRLYRSRRDRMAGGVCGGIAEYAGVDPVLVRIAAVALALSGGLGLLAYIIAWIVIPEAPVAVGAAPYGSPEEGGYVPADDPPVEVRGPAASLAIGIALVGAGVLLLLNQVAPWFRGDLVWPLVVVAVGGVLVTAGRRRR
jgi:phage shock protein C